MVRIGVRTVREVQLPIGQKVANSEFFADLRASRLRKFRHRLGRCFTRGGGLPEPNYSAFSGRQQPATPAAAAA
jgi:hypothetical protein